MWTRAEINYPGQMANKTNNDYNKTNDHNNYTNNTNYSPAALYNSDIMFMYLPDRGTNNTSSKRINNSKSVVLISRRLSVWFSAP